MAGDRVITMGTLGAKQEATNKDLADKIALRTGWVADGDVTLTTDDLGTDGTDVDVVNPAVKLKFFGGGAKVYDLGNQTAGINIPGAGEGPWWSGNNIDIDATAGDQFLVWGSGIGGGPFISPITGAATVAYVSGGAIVFLVTCTESGVIEISDSDSCDPRILVHKTAVTRVGW
jgi:hypothetical protein